MQIFNVQGVTSQAVRMAFDSLCDTSGPFDELTAPFFGPEDGGAFLRKKEYRFQLSYYRATGDLTVYYYGSVPKEELEAIERTLREKAFPKES